MPSSPYTSFAQNGEDVVIRRALAGVPQGRYVDVGANHPQQDSVSRGFYDAGWRGLTVEPVPALAALHREQRPDDVLFEGVVSGSAAETAVLHQYPEHGLSTTVDSVRDEHHRAGRDATDLTVRNARLDDLLTDLGWEDQPIHFLVMDTEGAESSVLSGLDLRRFRPWVLCIESTAPNSVTPTHESWEPGVLAAGYVFCLFDGLSRFYVAEEHAAQLGDALRYPACVLDGYRTWHLAAAQDRIAHLEQVRLEVIQDTLRWRTAALSRWAESLVPRHEPEVPELQRQLAVLHHEHEHTAAALAAHRSELEKTRRTLSWRVTRPLRLVSRLMRRA
ncbi:MAG TPA: FkbM family methyltransferase [Cellulomonas sp.]